MAMQQGQSVPTEEHHAPEGYSSWPSYWKAHGQPWRSEPGISQRRQQFLAERRVIQPDIARGLYPFSGVALTRADVEWLLTTHESGGMRGPVDWMDINQRTRQGLDLRGAQLQRAVLSELPLARVQCGLDIAEWGNTSTEGVDAAAANMERCMLVTSHLEEACLNRVQLQRADMAAAHLEGAALVEAHLEQADLFGAHLEGAILTGTYLAGAQLDTAYLDSSTNLTNVSLDNDIFGFAHLGRVRWGGADLSAISWSQAKKGVRRNRPVAIVLGEERVARASQDVNNRPKLRRTRLGEYEAAVRANHQLAVVLREQGLSEDADRFAYKAQFLQRQVLWLQGRPGAALGSLFLDLVAGYGYRPLRSFIAYVVIICAFAGAYLLNAQFAAPHLTWDEALVLSISSFHGRGFFPSEISLGDTLARVAAGEAIVGLLIEITFIATFTQRYLAR